MHRRAWGSTSEPPRRSQEIASGSMPCREYGQPTKLEYNDDGAGGKALSTAIFGLPFAALAVGPIAVPGLLPASGSAIRDDPP